MTVLHGGSGWRRARIALLCAALGAGCFGTCAGCPGCRPGPNGDGDGGPGDGDGGPPGAPEVLAVVPDRGPATGGTAVTIGGRNFQSGAKVTIGGQAPSAVSVHDAFTIFAKTPSGTPGSADVAVTNPDGMGGTLAGGFTYEPPAPKINRVEPDRGPTAGGVEVSVHGLNFVEGDQALIAGAPLTGAVEVQANRISGTLPPGSPGAVAASIRRSGRIVATAADAFTYVDPPAIARIHPPHGAAAGGSLLVVQGTRFVTGATLLVGGKQATTLSTGPTLIRAEVPPGMDATEVEVKVLNPDGGAAVAQRALAYHAYGVHGIATLNGGPIEQGWVRVFGAEHGAEAGAGALGPLGLYFAPLDGPGPYKVGLADTGEPGAAAAWSGGGASFLRAARIDVAGAARLDFTLAQTGVPIAGAVKDGAGAAVAGARVEVYDAEMDDLVAVTETGAGGSYRAAVAAQRAYLVRALFHPAGFGAAWHPDARSKALAVRVATSAQAPVDVTLRQGGFLSGTVQDGGGPLPNASIEVDDVATGEAGRFFTRSDGSFRFALPPASYRLHARPIGTARAAAWVQAAGGAQVVSAATPFTVTAGSDPAPLSITLGDGAPIEGEVVLDANSLPVAGARVTAFDAGLGGEVTFARAREDGSFTLLVPAGHYKLLAEPPLGPQFTPVASAYYGDRFERRRSRTVAGGTSGVSLRLRSAGIVEGRVLAPGGAPAAGVRVALEDAALGGEYLEARTRGDGTFAAAVRGGRKYKAYVDAGSPWFQLVGGVWNGDAAARLGAPEVDVAASAVADLGDLSAATRAQVAGLITDAATGDPAPGVTVAFWIDDDGFSYRAVSGHDGTYRASLPASPPGKPYVVEALPDGLPYLREFVSGAHSGCGGESRGSILLIDGDERTGPDLALDAGASISGTVVDDFTGDPVSDVFVQAWLRDESTGTCCSWNSGLRAAVAADGSFTVRVPAGSWSVRAWPSADSFYPQGTEGYNWAGDAETPGSTTCIGGAAFVVPDLGTHLTGAGIRLR